MAQAGVAENNPSTQQRLTRLGKRLGWGVADQAFSSLTNFLLGIFVARSVGVREFGAFAIIFTTYTLALGATRAVVGEPMGVRFSNTSIDRWRLGAASGTGVATVIGVTMGTLCIVGGSVLGGATQAPLLAFGVMMPALILQDSWRLAFFAASRGQDALLNDVVWAAVMIPGLVIASSESGATTTTFVLIWSGSAAIAAVFGCWQARSIPDPRAAKRWWQEQRDLIGGFFGDYVVRAGLTRVSIYGVVIVAGLQATAALRGADILLGPITVVFMGITPLTVPEAVRLVNRESKKLLQAMILLSAVFTILAIVVGLAMMALPSSIGRSLLRDTWEPAHAVVFLFALSMASSAANTGAMVGMRALGESKRMFGTRLITAPLVTAGILVGAVFGGAAGALVGNALATSLGDIFWWARFRAALRDWRARLSTRSGGTSSRSKANNT